MHVSCCSVSMPTEHNFTLGFIVSVADGLAQKGITTTGKYVGCIRDLVMKSRPRSLFLAKERAGDVTVSCPKEYVEP